MSAEMVSAWASVGTLVVVIATATAAFIQLRHMGVLNGLTVLNEFRQEYERVEGAAKDALPLIVEHLRDPAERAAMARGDLTWARPALPLMRLFEVLGSYTNRNIVSHDLVTDMWAPVISLWWDDFAPLIAVWRRESGPEMFENWEALALRSKRRLAEHRSSYPKRLPRMAIVDPWAVEDAAQSRVPDAV